MDLFDIRGGNICFINPSLTGISGGAKTYSYTGNPTYLYKGKFHAGATASGATAPSTDFRTGKAFTALGHNDICLFVWGWKTSDDSVAVLQGPIVNNTELANNAAALEFPSVPAGFVPFAYHSFLQAHASTTFTFGVDNWNAGTTTIGTVENVGLLPEVPETAATA